MNQTFLLDFIERLSLTEEDCGIAFFVFDDLKKTAMRRFY